MYLCCVLSAYKLKVLLHWRQQEWSKTFAQWELEFRWTEGLFQDVIASPISMLMEDPLMLSSKGQN